MSTYPICGEQTRQTIAPASSISIELDEWSPATYTVAWSAVPLTPVPATGPQPPQIEWKVQSSMAGSGLINYWVVVTNLSTTSAVTVSLRYAVLAGSLS